MPRWHKGLLIAAGAMVGVGLVLALVESGSASPAASGGAPPPRGASLVGGGAAASDTGTAAESGGWSPVFLKMGFSFFVGFAVGYVSRMFLKIVMLVAGTIALSMFGLSQLGLVEVHWQQMSDVFDSVMGHVRDQATGFRKLFTGSLPAAGLGALGLFTGFRKG
jgi:uncharacterized membrane protein (Fun14 family)